MHPNINNNYMADQPPPSSSSYFFHMPTSLSCLTNPISFLHQHHPVWPVMSHPVTSHQLLISNRPEISCHSANVFPAERPRLDKVIYLTYCANVVLLNYLLTCTQCHPSVPKCKIPLLHPSILAPIVRDFKWVHSRNVRQVESGRRRIYVVVVFRIRFLEPVQRWIRVIFS